MDMSLSWEERYYQLEAHHRRVVEWMHDELEKTTGEPHTLLYRFQKLDRQVRSIIESNLSWEETFHHVFEMYKRSDLHFDWYDPDTSYQEDVEAFANALARRVRELESPRDDY